MFLYSGKNILIFLTLSCTSPQSTCLIFPSSLESGFSNTLHRPFLTTCQIIYSPEKGRIGLQGFRNIWRENMNKQKRNFTYCISPQRPNQTAGAPIHYPVKASGDLKKAICLLLPYISISSFPMALIKRERLGFKIYKIGCAKIQRRPA